MTWRTTLAAAAALGVLASVAPAQGVRITGTTIARYVALRSMVDDSVPADSSIGTGTLRETLRGVAAYCADGAAWCHYKRSANSATSSVPLLQDLEASVWGFGEGIHGRVHVRGRAGLGSARDLWPQSDDEFDVIAAYVDVERARFRGRLGRQWRASGLGYSSFDGAALEFRAPWLDDAFTVDGWVGRSLVQGLHESAASGALEAVEDLAPDKGGILFGVEARYRPRAGAGVAIAYQRELRTDRSWLYSERVSADASLRLGRSGSVDGALALDLATGELNEARVGGQYPLGAGFVGNAQLRRYRPFFELWTIWGAFTPVGFSEASGGVSWAAEGSRLALAAEGGWRRYDDTDAGADFLPMKEDGWRLGAEGSYRLDPSWTTHASLRTELGFGASRTDGDVGIRWQRGDDLWLGALASAFQSVYEFRVGRGRVLGVGVDGGIRLRDDLRLAGDVALYRHLYGDLAPATDWNQTRASLRLEWSVGGDPGMASLGRGSGR